MLVSLILDEKAAKRKLKTTQIRLRVSVRSFKELQTALTVLNLGASRVIQSAPRSECQSSSLPHGSQDARRRFELHPEKFLFVGTFRLIPKKADSGGDAKDQQSCLLPSFLKK
ncbi:hypothetical protein CDAR_223601 [Caerostris darwini]|uniref:Uncharacterized protein n=1 Tax=Caerostris darwini TaxID=1538125 RepID=A0AAV4S146_9ARAC|nr:hypothetical protein CDAR_223601 [Caerostris darwini]